MAAQRIRAAFENDSYDLKLDNLNLTSLPAGFSLMTELRELSVRNNQLAQLPDLPLRLLALAITDNLFTHLPELPPYLEDLSASYNRLVELPVPPPSLKILCVEGNQLTSLPVLNGPIFLARLGNNRLTHLHGLPHTLRFISVEPALITTTIAQLEARIASLIHDTDFYAQQLATTPEPDAAASSSLPAQARATLPDPFTRFNAETTEALLANLETGSADLVALSRTSANFHELLQPRIEADREVETINAELILLRQLQQANRP